MRRIYEQWAIKIAKAERQILKEIRREQITVYSPERIAALWPDGYDLTCLSREKSDVKLELRVIMGVL